MTYFVISDIHGYYDVMIDSLSQHEFDATNPNHHLIVLGDMFDRGPDSNRVYEYLYSLENAGNATILLGNHDSFLLEFLEGDSLNAYFNIQYNGFGETLKSLSGMEPAPDRFDAIRYYILSHYEDLLPWLQQRPLYVEIGDYIFVHGGIDGGMLDWKTMSSRRDFIWGREHELPPVPGKTVVAGHTRVATLRAKTDNFHLLHLYNPKAFDILYLDGKIMIDRYVEVSQELNVLILSI